MARTAVVATVTIDLSTMSRPEKIVALWGQGWSLAQIGTELGLAKGTISYWVGQYRRAGLNLPWRCPPERVRNSTPGEQPSGPTTSEPTVSYHFAPKVAALDRLEPQLLHSRATRHNATCLYVLELRSDGFKPRYCDDPTERNASYCADHQGKCVDTTERRKQHSYSPNVVPADSFGSLGEIR